jgi:hypothetical protein
MINYLKKYGLTNNDFEKEVGRYSTTSEQLQYLAIVSDRLYDIRQNFIDILVCLDESLENTRKKFSFKMLATDYDIITSNILQDIRESEIVWSFDNIFEPLEDINRELFSLIEFIDLSHCKITSLSSFRIEKNVNDQTINQYVSHGELRKAADNYILVYGEKYGFKKKQTITKEQKILIKEYCLNHPPLKHNSFIQKLIADGYCKDKHHGKRAQSSK